MQRNAIETEDRDVVLALQAFRRHLGIARLDGGCFTWQVGGSPKVTVWMLHWSQDGEKSRLIIRTRSFERYAEAVTLAITARKPASSRKPPANAPAVSNCKSAKA